MAHLNGEARAGTDIRSGLDLLQFELRLKLQDGIAPRENGQAFLRCALTLLCREIPFVKTKGFIWS
jgi:hypothetical protein